MFKNKNNDKDNMSFDTNSNPIEVFIVTNDNGITNGFAEVSSVAQMLSPYTRVTSTQLWNSTPTCYKIQNNGKNFVHAFVVCKYLAAIPESDAPSYKNLRQLVHDLTIGGDTHEQLAPSAELLSTIELLHTKIDQLQSHNESVLGNLGALLNVTKSEIMGEIKELVYINVPSAHVEIVVPAKGELNEKQQ
ncbi:P24 [Mocis latipes granulovirus]|uniref:P24 n=1 Tax=Mocis latipes granulovirus TaxID=2072024 RepID=A0A162GVP3_9BBAC|nr:P24 [Mocis latipes granulovirus]AKR17434.1 P24 [Mocis latipes granulovirus]